MTEKYKRKPDQLLMDTIGFDEDDLAANRAGKLGPNQKSRLRRMRQTAITNSFMGIITGISVLMLGLFLLLLGLRAAVVACVLLGAVPVIITALLILRNAWWVRQTARAELFDVQNHTVERIEGRVSLDVQTGSSATRGKTEQIVRIDDCEWIVSQEVFLAFKNGDPYALYYALRSNVLLAAEWLREPPPGMDTSTDDDDDEPVDTQAKPKRGSMGR